MSDEQQSIDIGSCRVAEVTVFDTCKSKRPAGVLPFCDFIQDVQSGRWRQPIEEVRAALQQSKRAGQLAKTKLLPVIKVAGVFSSSADIGLVKHSGLLCLDFDDVGDDLAGATTQLRQDPYCVAYCTSPSGKGLKVFVPVNAINADQHKQCFEQACLHYQAISSLAGKLDRAPQAVSANCFAAWDPHAWIAGGARKVFKWSGENRHKECDIDSITVIESNEKESFSSSPSSAVFDKAADRADLQVNSINWSLPAGLPRIDGFLAKKVYPNWMAGVLHEPSKRNKVISDRVPILLSLAGERQTADMLLRWFMEAPEGMYSATRQEHWVETLAMIRGCVSEYAANKKVGLSEIEKRSYEELPDRRRREVFRICRSLSLSKKNVGRVFFLPAAQLGNRIGCACESASRQLEYLTRDGVLEVVHPGKQWEPGVRQTATRYRWALAGC